MEIIWQCGINVIIAIQQIHGPLLDTIFRFVTFLGTEEFFLIFLPFILWCIDFGLGVRLAALFLLANYINFYLKDLVQHPRPFDLEPSLKLAEAEGFGLPSGHAQSAIVAWGVIAAWGRKTWLLGLAIALIILIGFSRVYLGVHFPTDVLAGWIIGGILLATYLAVQPRVERWASQLRLWRQILLALAMPIALVLLHPTKDTVTVLAPLSGGGVGLALAHRCVPFSTRGPWCHRIARFLIGGIVVLALYWGLKMVFPSEESTLYLVFRFLRYGLMGVWVMLGAPWLFGLLRLTQAEMHT